jgi:hypothetical protein
MRDPDLRRIMGLAEKLRIPLEFSRQVYLRNLAGFYDDVLTS